jgi:hypothetical protein
VVSTVSQGYQASRRDSIADIPTSSLPILKSVRTSSRSFFEPVYDPTSKYPH